METFINELSVRKDLFCAYADAKDLKETYRGLREIGITTCWAENSVLSNIIQSAECYPQGRDIKNLIFSFFHSPYSKSELARSKEDEYLTSEWRYKGETCAGLAMSHLTDSLSFSFRGEDWNEFVVIRKDGSTVKVRNASCERHVIVHRPWIETFNKVELLKSNLTPNQKSIKLRDDHGKDLLSQFAKKLCNSDYVIGVVNSIPFNCKEKSFIRKCKEDGKIECVLTWTDAGYGLVVQTTGRNQKETERIAEILNREYAK